MDNEELRVRVTEIVSAGLVSGLGSAKPGATCVEGAIALAMGEGLTDAPSCVAEPDRRFAIVMNDARWSSPEARARGLLPLALAQLGTAGTDRVAWAQRVAEGTIRKVLPMVLREVAARIPSHAEALEAAAVRCERDGDRAAADAAYVAAADAAAAAARAADADAANAAAYAAARAADADADAAYVDAAYAAADAAATYVAAADAADKILLVAVEVALDAYCAEGRT